MLVCIALNKQIRRASKKATSCHPTPRFIIPSNAAKKSKNQINEETPKTNPPLNPPLQPIIGYQISTK